MTIKSGALNKASLEARRWAARLCLAADDAETNEVLGPALLDMGFDVIDAVQKRPEGGVDLCWSSQGGELVSSDDPFVNARGEVLSRLDPDVHRWIAVRTGSCRRRISSPSTPGSTPSSCICREISG